MNSASYKTLLLCYRDGYLIEKTLEIIKKYVNFDFKVDEIHLPRYLRHAFYSQKGGLLRSLVDMGITDKLTVGEFISHRMYVTEASLKERAFALFKKCGYTSFTEPVVDYHRLLPVISALDEIYSISTEEYTQTIKQYITDKVSGGNVAIFDIGYRASITRFCAEFMGVQIPEFQMFSNSGFNYVTCNAPVETYISYPTEIARSCSILEILFENILSSMEPELVGIGFDNDSNKFYYKFGSYPPGNNLIDQVQQGVLHYVEYSMGILKEKLLDLKSDSFFEWSIIVDYLLKPELSSAEIISKLYRPDSSQIKGSSQDNPFGGWYYANLSRNKNER